MTAAELKNRTLVAATVAKQQGFLHTYDALISIVQELEAERRAEDRAPVDARIEQFSSPLIRP